MAEHTPGPWKLRGNGWEQAIAVGSGKTIIGLSLRGTDDKTAQANAALIAAAPTTAAERDRLRVSLRKTGEALATSEWNETKLQKTVAELVEAARDAYDAMLDVLDEPGADVRGLPVDKLRAAIERANKGE